MTRIQARIAAALGALMLLALTTGCDSMGRAEPADLSGCLMRRVGQIHAGWDGQGAPCVIVTWDRNMVPRPGDRDVDESGGAELLAAMASAGYANACGFQVTTGEEDRAEFASRFGALGERVWEWHADMFLPVDDGQREYCLVFLDG